MAKWRVVPTAPHELSLAGHGLLSRLGLDKGAWSAYLRVVDVCLTALDMLGTLDTAGSGLVLYFQCSITWWLDITELRSGKSFLDCLMSSRGWSLFFIPSSSKSLKYYSPPTLVSSSPVFLKFWSFQVPKSSSDSCPNPEKSQVIEPSRCNEQHLSYASGGEPTPDLLSSQVGQKSYSYPLSRMCELISPQ